VLLRKDSDLVKRCMEYEVEGARPRAIPKKTWKEIVGKEYEARELKERRMPWIIIDGGSR